MTRVRVVRFDGMGVQNWYATDGQRETKACFTRLGAWVRGRLGLWVGGPRA